MCEELICVKRLVTKIENLKKWSTLQSKTHLIRVCICSIWSSIKKLFNAFIFPLVNLDASFFPSALKLLSPHTFLHFETCHSNAFWNAVVAWLRESYTLFCDIPFDAAKYWVLAAWVTWVQRCVQQVNLSNIIQRLTFFFVMLFSIMAFEVESFIFLQATVWTICLCPVLPHLMLLHNLIGIHILAFNKWCFFDPGE